jgi:adenylosuccinate synthase
MTRNITVWGACRTYPIRVGSLPGTTSGDGYNDQRETSWDNLGVYGIVPEYTTVTGRERRVFTWSNMQIEQAMVMCDPDHIFLNFCNYMTPSGLAELLATMPPAAEERVSLLGYGPKSSDIREYIRG